MPWCRFHRQPESRDFVNRMAISCVLRMFLIRLQWGGNMQKDKLISLGIVLIWLGAIFFLSRGEGAEAEPFNPLAWLVLPLAPLALIWFGDELGDYVGPTARGRITHTSPGWLVKFFGWLFLLALIGFPLYIAILEDGAMLP